MPPEFPPASPADTPPPIADYELLRLIGRGSYGDVWLARGVTGVFRAVKVVWRDRFPDVRPYEREFEGITRFTAISLREPSQLALLHAGRQDAAGFFYYVMELADDTTRGREIDPDHYAPCTLKDFAAARGQRLEVAEVVALGTALARALASLHAAGLVHRDIKPSNVILVGGVPKFADVGLVAPASAQLTFVGTEGFVPPEGPGAPSADVYSLGKLLYELATGLDRHDYPRLPPDLDTRPDQRALLELNEVLVRACEPDARQRFADAGALLDELLLLQAGKSVRRLRRAERRTARALRFAAVLAVVAALAGAGAWVERKRAEEETQLRRAAEAERDALAQKAAYSSAVERAQIAIESGELGRARLLLGEAMPTGGAPDPRGFEWHALWREAQGDPADVLRETGSTVLRLHISPDQGLIAAQDADSNVTIWDRASGQIVGRSSNVFVLAGFSADSKWIMGVGVSAARRAGLRRWSVATGQPDGDAIDEGKTHRPITVLAGHRLVSFTDSRDDKPHIVRAWDFSEAREMAQMPVPRHLNGSTWEFYRPNAAAMTLDGKLCALVLISGRVANARWKLSLYDFPSGRVVFSETFTDRINAITFSPDGQRLAAAVGNTAEVRQLDVASGAWRWKGKPSRGPATTLAFSPDGRTLAAGTAELEILHSDTGEPVSRLRGNSAAVECLAWLPDNSSLVSASTTGDIRVWKNRDGEVPTELGGLWIPSGGGRRLCVSSDGSRLAATDTPTKGPLAVATANHASLGRGPSGWLPVAFVGGSDEIVGLRPNGLMERRQIRTEGEWPIREAARIFDGDIELGSSAMLSGDGRVLVVGSVRGQVVCWNVPEARRLATLDSGNTSLGFVAISHDGKLALTGGSSRSHARLWDVATGERRAQFATLTHAPLCGAFSGDGRQLALGWADGSVEIHEIAAAKLVRRIRSHSLLIQNLAFSPDGKAVFCGAPNGNLHVFALDDGREIVTLRAAQKTAGAADSRISNLAFSGNGSLLAAYLNDGRIRIWRR